MLTWPRAFAVIACAAAFLWAGVLPPSTAQAAPADRADRSAGAALRPRLPADAALRLDKELDRAWRISKGRGVTVAVLSTGVAGVSLLSGKVTFGPDYAPVPNPVLTDGTVLAGLIAGRGQASATPAGTFGRAPAARILSVRIVAFGSGKAGAKYQTDGTWQGIEAKAIRYAVGHGAKVIVSDESGGLPRSAGPADTQPMASAVAYAISRNVVVIAEDLANTIPTEVLPDDLPGVINVAGRVVPGLPAPNTPQRFGAGPSVLIAAPSNDSYTTGPGDQPLVAWGSFSSLSWTAATVSLIKSAYPDISPADVDLALAESASYRPAHGYSPVIGFGLINPVGALRAAGRLQTLSRTATPGPDALGPGTRLASGPRPGVIKAAPRSLARIAGGLVAIVIGLALIFIAIEMLLRRARARRLVRPW